MYILNIPINEYCGFNQSILSSFKYLSSYESEFNMIGPLNSEIISPISNSDLEKSPFPAFSIKDYLTSKSR